MCQVGEKFITNSNSRHLHQWIAIQWYHCNEAKGDFRSFKKSLRHNHHCRVVVSNNTIYANTTVREGGILAVPIQIDKNGGQNV